MRDGVVTGVAGKSRVDQAHKTSRTRSLAAQWCMKDSANMAVTARLASPAGKGCLPMNHYGLRSVKVPTSYLLE